MAKRAIINNIDSFDKFINTIAKDGKIDIEGIVDEEIEIIKSIPNFDFNIPVLGNGNISNGNITLSIPFINKGIMFNQSDFDDMIFESAISFWFDDVDFGEDKLWKYFNELK